MKRIERAMQLSDGPVSIYLMLMESKVDVLKQLQRKEGSKPDPQVKFIEQAIVLTIVWLIAL